MTRPRFGPAAGGPLDRRVEAVAWLAIVGLACALRLPGLAARGTWDADQGHDMLVLRALVLDGQIPLLGPPTSIGAFHHGVLYYWILAPAAFASRADPVVVTTWIALLGVLAVAVTGWFARSIAGPVAGLVAGLLLAVSASAVEESIFIWNPNVIALTSSIALAAAWCAHMTGSARWWVVAGVGAVATMHGHVLGVILTPVIAGLLVADWRRSRQTSGDDAPPSARAFGVAAVAWLAIAAASYVPLLVHELGNSGSEVRALLAFVAGGGGSSGIPLLARLPIVLVRVLGWPLGGLVTDAPVAALATSALVIGIVVWRAWLAASVASDERTAVRWLGLGLGWTVVALAVAAPSLASVVPGLPNDHYHAFADPIVVAIVAIGLAALASLGAGSSRNRPMAAAGAAIVVGLVVVQVMRQPPAVAADGGWRAADAAARRVIAATGGRPMILTSLPTFKSEESLRMPLEAAGIDVAGRPAEIGAARADRPVVILCDELFRAAIGAACGGPAEDDDLEASGAGSAGADVLDRFEAAPGRWVSIYRPR